MHEIWRTFLKNRLAAVGGGLLVLLAIVAIGAPVLATHDPYATGGEQLASPGGAHWLGTDDLARDVFSRVVYGTRISLRVAAVAVAIASVAGSLVGLIAGFFRGWVDGLLSRLTDILFALPPILLALVVVAILGQGLWKVTLAIGIVYTPIFARVMRGSVLQVMGAPYVEAARATGCGWARVCFRHVLPNAMGPVLVQITLSLAFAILAEAALSFLGLTGEADLPSWGLMLKTGQRYMQHGAWWLAVFPGLAITFTVLSFNLVGDGLRDALDPKR